jgi:hypothetical protein
VNGEKIMESRKHWLPVEVSQGEAGEEGPVLYLFPKSVLPPGTTSTGSYTTSWVYGIISTEALDLESCLFDRQAHY